MARMVEASQDAEPVEAEETLAQKLYREICDLLRKFNSELTKMAQDRRYRFITQKMFHDSADGENTTGEGIYNYYDEDDDVLFVLKDGAGGFHYVLANIEHVMVSDTDIPENANQSAIQMHLRSGAVRRNVPIDYPHQRRVALFLRLYEEVDKSGKILSGYGNHNCKYYHLPAETRQPLEYRLADCVLGHVRLDPAIDGCTKAVVKRLEDKCGKKFLSRLRVETRDDGERVAKDRTDLIALHVDQ